MTPLIEGKLFQSAKDVEILALYLKHRPSLVIDCVPGLPLIGLRVKEMYIKIPFDDRLMPQGGDGIKLITRLCEVAHLGAMLIRNGESILTHCKHDENRSSLVNGMILLELRNMGILTFKRVVDFINNRRPGALTNSSFISFLDTKYGGQ